MAGHEVGGPGGALILRWTRGQLAVPQPAQMVPEYGFKCLDKVGVLRDQVVPGEGVPGVTHGGEEGAEAVEAGPREGVARAHGGQHGEEEEEEEKDCRPPAKEAKDEAEADGAVEDGAEEEGEAAEEAARGDAATRLHLVEVEHGGEHRDQAHLATGH